MTRVTGALLTATTRPLAEHVEMRVCVYLDLPTGSVLLCDGPQNFIDPSTFDEYIATGGLGDISELKEDVDRRPNAVRLSLSGVDPAYTTEILDEDFVGQDCNILIGFVSRETGQPLASPYEVFTGIIDQATIEITPQGAAITLTIQDESAKWSRARPILYSDATHRDLHSGDKAFDQLVYLIDRKINFMGGAATAGSGGGGHTGGPFRKPNL